MPEPAIRYWHALTAPEINHLAKRGTRSSSCCWPPWSSTDRTFRSRPTSTSDWGSWPSPSSGLPAARFRSWHCLRRPWVRAREHARFPGTLSLPPALLGDLIHRAGDGPGTLRGAPAGRDEQPRRKPRDARRRGAAVAGRGSAPRREGQLSRLPPSGRRGPAGGRMAPRHPRRRGRNSDDALPAPRPRARGGSPPASASFAAELERTGIAGSRRKAPPRSRGWRETSMRPVPGRLATPRSARRTWGGAWSTTTERRSRR